MISSLRVVDIVLSWFSSTRLSPRLLSILSSSTWKGRGSERQVLLLLAASITVKCGIGYRSSARGTILEHRDGKRTG